MKRNSLTLLFSSVLIGSLAAAQAHDALREQAASGTSLQGITWSKSTFPPTTISSDGSNSRRASGGVRIYAQAAIESVAIFAGEWLFSLANARVSIL